jgi:hypothetical protein
MIPQERGGYKGELFMGINPTHIPKLLFIIVYNLLLLLSVPKANHLTHVRGWV